jgi:hypothetical protein
VLIAAGLLSIGFVSSCTQVLGVQPLGVLQRLLVPAFPVGTLITRDEQDSLAPGVEGEQDPHFAAARRTRPQFFEVLDRGSLDRVGKRPRECRTFLLEKIDGGCDEFRGPRVFPVEHGEPFSYLAGHEDYPAGHVAQSVR